MSEVCFSTGSIVLRREVLHGRLWMESEVHVVSDTEDCLAVLMVPGSRFTFPDHPVVHPWGGFSQWSGTTVLQLHRPQEAYGAWKFFSAEGEFTHWYINFEEPIIKHADPLCFDTDDHGIDIVIPSDGSGWYWKDYDDPEQYVVDGRFTREKADEVMQYAHQVAAEISAGPCWWSAWDDWSPPPTA